MKIESSPFSLPVLLPRLHHRILLGSISIRDISREFMRKKERERERERMDFKKFRKETETQRELPRVFTMGGTESHPLSAPSC